MPKLPQHPLQPHNISISRARPIPQIIILQQLFFFTHTFASFPFFSVTSALPSPPSLVKPFLLFSAKSQATLRLCVIVLIFLSFYLFSFPSSPHPSFSRSICIPRCKFTRTDPAVSPVRSAISGPVIASTNRKINGAR